MFCQGRLCGFIETAEEIDQLNGTLKLLCLETVKKMIIAKFKSLEVDEQRKTYYNTLPITKILKSDMIQHILSFIELKKPILICKQFKLLADKNESNKIPFHCLIFMANNVLMHSMVYLYHSNMILCVKKSNTFYYLTRIQGYNQLLSGIFFCSLSMFVYDQFKIIYLWTIFCYSLYLSLFQWELYHSWKGKQAKQS